MVRGGAAQIYAGKSKANGYLELRVIAMHCLLWTNNFAALRTTKRRRQQSWMAMTTLKYSQQRTQSTGSTCSIEEGAFGAGQAICFRQMRLANVAYICAAHLAGAD
eukprot:scaffold292827_cov34-Prasinocladus_malaysianus.AAC.1